MKHRPTQERGPAASHDAGFTKLELVLSIAAVSIFLAIAFLILRG